MTEDLNLHRMRLRIISKCWYDIERFPSVTSISKATGMSERTLFRFAQDNDLPGRAKKNIRKHIKENLQVC